MAYKVVQWGTGNVGLHALRAILERPDLDLIGVRVYDPAKVGRDAGDLVGGSSTGILCTNDVDALLALEADCVNFNGLGTTLVDPFAETLDDLCRILSSGMNVTTTALDLLIYPESADPLVTDRLEKACQVGQSTFFGSGVNPGFTMDLWPITMTRISRTIDRIHVVESISMRTYSSANVMAFLGFGCSPDAPSQLDVMHSDRSRSPFFTSLAMVADALRFELEDIKYTREVALADVPIETAVGTVEPGTIAVTKIQFVGIANGREVLANQFIWRVSDEVAPQWEVGDKWILEIDGDPTFRSEMYVATQSDAQRPTSLTVAMAGVNAIPTVCESGPGVRSVLSLPTWGGGYLS